MNEEKRPRTTEQFAKDMGVKPASIRTRLSRVGHYFGIVPERWPNGRLRWPAAQ